ncbi:uncharacterized protein LOC141604919 [Silene latifolia]|uniref:uncharacterized protein LOC141604919 n=1 Tax=Silene latifolia TaxID=37657 RepID=UPI003D7865C4
MMLGIGRRVKCTYSDNFSRLLPSTLLNFLSSPSINLNHFCSDSGLMESDAKMGSDEKVAGSGREVTRVLFCGHQFPASHLYTREYLSNYPHIQVDEFSIENVPSVIGNYHICIPKMMKINSDLISRAKKMKLILQFGVGLEGVDVDSATKHGIKVARIPAHATGNAASCAEMAIYLMLGLLRMQKEMEISIKMKRLGTPAGETLFGKTVFIMGLGSIGRELAKRLKPFDVRILATKRRWNVTEEEDDGVANLVDEKGTHDDIYKFAGMADIVVCCLNMNRQTAGVIDHLFVLSMKKGAYLVNIARGGLLDYDAIVQGLESGHLGGLGIDVAWTEPFDPTDRVLQFPNVIITPHVAGVTEHSYRAMAKVVGDVALQLHEGKPMTEIEVVN